MWAERPEPEVIAVEANPAEDAVAGELSSTWLHPPDGSAPITGGGQQLFPWTMAKAFLSSPAALVETIENRKRTLAARNEMGTAEGTALTRLGKLATEAREHGSAKLDALVAHLRQIGVGKGSDTRVVLFSERVATLNWLRREPRPTMRSNKDYTDWDLETLEQRQIPRTNYQRARPVAQYMAGYPTWKGKPANQFWRLAWRNMVDSIHST